MWKYNKYNVGNIVFHSEKPSLEFQVINILRGEPDVTGHYMYHCRFLNDLDTEILNYIEDDLNFIRKGSQEELELLLKQAVDTENFEVAEALKNELRKLE